MGRLHSTQQSDTDLAVSVVSGGSLFRQLNDFHEGMTMGVDFYVRNTAMNC